MPRSPLPRLRLFQWELRVAGGFRGRGAAGMGGHPELQGLRCCSAGGRWVGDKSGADGGIEDTEKQGNGWQAGVLMVG